MSSVKRMFQSFERLVDAGAELTKRDPLPLLVAIVLVLFLAGCDSPPMSNENFIAEVARCEANGYAARSVTSSWDGDRTGVQCYTPYVFEPRITEFKLADGTRCVMFSTPQATSRRAGSSGASCDWNNNAD